jgi:hypothetical protein
MNVIFKFLQDTYELPCFGFLQRAHVSVIVFVLIGKRVNENIGIIIIRKRRDLIG